MIHNAFPDVHPDRFKLEDYAEDAENTLEDDDIDDFAFADAFY
jgi:hypothetical protein